MSNCIIKGRKGENRNGANRHGNSGRNSKRMMPEGFGKMSWEEKMEMLQQKLQDKFQKMSEKREEKRMTKMYERLARCRTNFYFILKLTVKEH